MTGFKPGDRVHVEFDGEVCSLAYRERDTKSRSPSTTLVVLYRDGSRATTVVEERDCTLVRPPLRVGDVLTADDPEPPANTVVFDGNQNVRRLIAGEWEWMGGNAHPQDWWSVYKPVTVLWVPEDTT